MKNPTLIKLIGFVKAFFKWRELLKKEGKFLQSKQTAIDLQIPKDIIFCHKDKVHIFVRGLADNKLHSAKFRNYRDVRFYKKQDLKVFCATCRKRII